MDKLDFLDGAEAPVEEAVTETPAAEVTAEAPAPEETETETQARERDERGRFKTKEPQDQTMVPLTALHETRDKVRALETELQQLRQPQQPPQHVAPPDIFEDPEGFVQYQNVQLQAATLNTTLNISEEMTRQSAGVETVNEAQQWGAQAFAANPAFYQQFLQQRNPYGFLVEHYRRATTQAKLGDDPAEIEAYLAWKQAQAQVQPAATPQTQPTPRGSIASAPSAGGMQQIAVGPGVAFSETIK